MRGIPPIVIVLAAVLGMGALVVGGGIGFFLLRAWFGVPLFASGPDQPIAFPHTVHAGAVEDGGLGLECSFCHRNVESGAAATIPSVQQCMFCHSQVEGTTETARVEIAILREAAEVGAAINWARVHRLPDHVQFVHEAHIRFFSGDKTVVERLSNDPETAQGQIKLSDARDIDPDAAPGGIVTVSSSAVCSTCHGAVEEMTKVKQVRSLKMGDCVDCHRENSSPTDCGICHY